MHQSEEEEKMQNNVEDEYTMHNEADVSSRYATIMPIPLQQAVFHKDWNNIADILLHQYEQYLSLLSKMASEEKYINLFSHSHVSLPCSKQEQTLKIRIGNFELVTFGLIMVDTQIPSFLLP